MVCGDADFVAEARRARKVLGGGMRQAGVIAAAGIVALEQMTTRLSEDHARAKRLADGLAEMDAFEVDPVLTNILYFRLSPDVKLSAYAIASRLKEQNILIGPRSERTFRVVTHYWIDDEGVERTLAALSEAIKEA